MRGVILAGGLGSRLLPLTKVTNKHLLPVYHKPMIYYPIETLVEAGVKELMIVTGGNSAGDFLKLIGNGRSMGLDHVSFAYQEGEGGIADALRLARHFANGQKMVVMLGDNIIGSSIRGAVQKFEKQKAGARVLLKKVPDPERFGVAELKGNRIVSIEEKPKKPKSHYAITGIYMYDEQVFEIISDLKPSRRGEFEITDVNNWYLKKGLLEYDMLQGFWSDAGTFESLTHSAKLIRAQETRRKK
ncbi:MAG TPA: sugar phosphate nucleotidyltransferase [Candidatus Omnitrophota bacterium]|nr:sugar phosphate nucleotidyltransferase [Candidatus Omnitrophota bacterium]